MKKFIFSLCALALITVACEEDDLVANNPAPSKNNVELAFIPYYGDSVIKTDSIYRTASNNMLVIDSIRFFMSNFYFITVSQDTLEEDYNFHAFSTSDIQSQRIASLPGGGYNGRFSIVMGLDSLAALEVFLDGDLSSEFQSYKRLVGPSYNHFEFYGHIFKPNSTDTVPTIPITYQIGTSMLIDTLQTEIRAFSVDDTKKVNLVLLCDIKPAIDAINLFETQTILSDMTSFQDMANAQQFRDSLKFGIF
jgi:hypothetical protein